MKEYYRNYDPAKVDIRGKRPSERRVLHIVSTALSLDTLKDAIVFTFDDHPIIPELVMNSDATLDEILDEKGVLKDKEYRKLRELEVKLSTKKRKDLLEWVVDYCNKFFMYQLFLLPFY